MVATYITNNKHASRTGRFYFFPDPVTRHWPQHTNTLVTLVTRPGSGRYWFIILDTVAKPQASAAPIRTVLCSTQRHISVRCAQRRERRGILFVVCPPRPHSSHSLLLVFVESIRLTLNKQSLSLSLSLEKKLDPSLAPLLGSSPRYLLAICLQQSHYYSPHSLMQISPWKTCNGYQTSKTCSMTCLRKMTPRNKVYRGVLYIVPQIIVGALSGTFCKDTAWPWP